MSAANVATFWKQASEGVTYYRCTLPARHLPGKVIGLRPSDLQERGEEPFKEICVPRQEGSAVWSFPGNTTRALIISHMQDQGTPVFFECDDNYTIPPSMPQISSWKNRYDGTDDHSYEIASRISRFCDGVIVSTPELAKVYSRLNKNVHVAPNCIDPDDWEDPKRKDDGILRIGWAASASHGYDSFLIQRALHWLSVQPDVEVVIMGIKPNFGFPYTHVPWEDSLEGYRRTLAGLGLDVMLCPVKDTAWNRCKSDVKAMEGAMAGAMAVVSRVAPFEPWFDRTYSASTKKEFLNIVKYLVKNRGEIPKLARDARDYVLSERTIQKGVKAWETALSSA